jgi:protein-S-isoprenylcysteine O-methyltransferase Ste14
MKKIIIPPVFLLISFILIAAFYFILEDYNYIIFPYNFFGIIPFFGGFVLTGKAHDLFKKYKTTHTYDQPIHLIDEGIFAKTRNPIYLGMILFLLGLAICCGNLFSLAVPFLFLIIIELVFIPMEEKIMESTFGEQYNEYKKRVHRWI